jgi:hypothetical protein
MKPTTEQLEQAVIAAALDLFNHTLSAGFVLPIPGTTPTVVVAAGTAEHVSRLIESP